MEGTAGVLQASTGQWFVSTPLGVLAQGVATSGTC